jgi:hypothetical protein
VRAGAILSRPDAFRRAVINSRNRLPFSYSISLPRVPCWGLEGQLHRNRRIERRMCRCARSEAGRHKRGRASISEPSHPGPSCPRLVAVGTENMSHVVSHDQDPGSPYQTGIERCSRAAVSSRDWRQIRDGRRRRSSRYLCITRARNDQKTCAQVQHLPH